MSEEHRWNERPDSSQDTGELMNEQDTVTGNNMKESSAVEPRQLSGDLDNRQQSHSSIGPQGEYSYNYRNNGSSDDFHRERIYPDRGQDGGQSRQRESTNASNAYNYYQVHQDQQQTTGKIAGPKRKKVPLKDSLSKKFGLTITFALVFGLVAGLAFQGVNVASSYLRGDEQKSSSQVGKAELLTTDGSQGAAGSAASSEGTVANVAKNAMPSVVAIASVSVQEIPNFFGYGTEQYASEGSGSGIIVGENDDELLIATNNHVVEGAQTLSVCFIGDDVVTAEQEQLEMSSGSVDTDSAVSAKIKGTDPDNDLAVIAVQKSDIPEETMNVIKIAQIGNSDDLEVGEQVVAIGNALGYGQSVTSGYVSALDRKVTVDNITSSLIQTDAAINPGNSGGALLNMQGQVIGINSAKLADASVEGMGYAIPISKASPILNELMNRETRDKVEDGKSGYLGVTVTDITSEMTQMYNMPEGVFVMDVTEDSAASKAGIQKGDIITSLDGQKVTGKNDLVDRLLYYAAGEEIPVVIERADDGQYVEKELTVKLDERPADTQTTEQGR